MNEREIETVIDELLRNLGWKLYSQAGNGKNVFHQDVKTPEQKRALGGKRPDYVLYETDSERPLIVIEVKRPNSNIEKAIEQALSYAVKINAAICYATDGVYIKTLHVKTRLPLYKNDEEIQELIKEQEAIQFFTTNSIDTLDKKVISSRKELIYIFKKASDLLRQEGIRQEDRFSEFSNILFLKIISEMQDKDPHSNLAYNYRWNYFKEKRGSELLDYVNDTVLKNFKHKYREEDIFDKLVIKDPTTLEGIIDELDPLSLIDTNSDIKGDAFEYFLRKYTSTETDLGEYFTPRHVVKACVQLINPTIGERIYDPFCGTGGMLIESFKYIQSRMNRSDANNEILRKHSIFGHEITLNARISKMNMILMGDGHNNIHRIDSLANPINGKFDIVITNMPFSLKPPEKKLAEYNNNYDLPSSADGLCIQHCIKSIDKYSANGRIAIIVPDGILETQRNESIRKYMFDRANVQTVVSLPPGVFAPYSNTVKTNILLLTNIKQKIHQKHYWYFRVGDGNSSQLYSKKAIEQDLDSLIAHRETPEHSKKYIKVEIQKVQSNAYKMIPKSTEINNRFAISLFEICTRSNIKAGNEYMEYEHVSISSDKKGFVQKNTFYKKHSQQSEPNIHTLKASNVVKKNEFAYRPEGLDIGTVGYNTGEKSVMVSGAYPVFSINLERVLPEYLYRIITSIEFRNTLRKNMSGTARAKVTFEDFVQMKIPLPPIQQQKKIVEKHNKILLLQASIQNIEHELQQDITEIWNIH